MATLSLKSIAKLKEVGYLISIARKKRGLSILELAKRVGIDRRTLSKLENGSEDIMLSTFFSVLDSLNLLDGIEEIVNECNDIEGKAIEIYRIRRKFNKNSIPDSKVNF